MPAPKVLVRAQSLRTLVTEVFVARGCKPTDAETIADTLVWANLRGIDSHGVSRVPRYLELFDKGDSAPDAEIEVSRLRSAIVLVDAHTAPGPVAMTRAAAEVVTAAAETGVAWAAVRGTVHTGAIGYYTTHIADAGMAGLGLVAGGPTMAYHGSRAVGVATSPLSIAVPSPGRPVLLDMATAVIALGRLAQLKASGTELAPGVALTKDGRPTTDPTEAAIPLPVGGAKGSGMSLLFELLASGLVANPIVSRYHSDDPAGRRHRQNGALLAIDVSAFQPLGDFQAIVGDTVAAIKGLPREDETREILVPGERGDRSEEQRRASGVPLGPKVWKELTDAATSLGIDVPDPIE
ncbi:MAG TPA: Ldh family oxidoreductase [Actinomycetes bacterium]|nr:Ldh family oxidoreductase [Actinomycetes bacterium]